MQRRQGAGRAVAVYQGGAGRAIDGSRAYAWIAAQLAGERERWAYWLPVAFACGIGGYFTLPVEPPFWLGTAGVAFALLLAVAGRLHPSILLPALAVAVVAGGFAAAQLRTQAVAAPVLEREHGPVDVVGRVIEVEARNPGDRLLLAEPEVDRLSRARTPARVRVNVAGGAEGIAPGDRVRVYAVLRPPPEPAAPGAFDFARQAYFERLGAVGYVLGSVERLRAPPPTGWRAFRLWWAESRHAIAEDVRTTLPGESGTVAAALMTGARGAIPDDTMAAIRDAGLAHLLAISGLHLGLVAGMVFFSTRALLAAWPWAALRWPIKKLAVIPAVLAAGGYLLLVGATVPTQRAFLMTATVLLAVVLDRSALTMRLVAWAAVAVLLISPESLLGASFQMSFAAVTALVAFYETLREKGWSPFGERRPVARLGLYMLGVALTSVVAILATGPLAAFHFNRVALFGLAANMVAVPLTALWIMPLGLLAFFLMPLGLESFALVPMGWGIDAVILAARTVSDWPGAALIVPSMPRAGLLAIVFGALWLCLWMRPWRYWGLLALALGFASLLLVRTPDVLVSEDGRLFAVRGGNGGLLISTHRRARFTAGVWLRRAGQEDGEGFPDVGLSQSAALACDPLGCLYSEPEGERVALLTDGRALAEDCRIATVLIATFPVSRSACAEPYVVIDRFDLWREGAHAITFVSGGAVVETARQRRGRRPWVQWRGEDG